MTKAPSPMIGGMIRLPVEVAVSIAAAISGLNPCFFICGMVTRPVMTTLATAWPTMVPTSALPTTAG